MSMSDEEKRKIEAIDTLASLGLKPIEKTISEIKPEVEMEINLELDDALKRWKKIKGVEEEPQAVSPKQTNLTSLEETRANRSGSDKKLSLD